MAIKNNKYKIILISIIFFAFLIRFWRLGEPNNFYFDEVYHAFTAKQMLLGKHTAWEFWNTPPSGFAYEWTHPPLAKIFMAAGMTVFGMIPFGWRFFGALAGVGNIFLIYLIGKKLFQSKKTAIFAAFLLSFETLSFTQSRIGMNDTYFIFFLLLAIYFLIWDKFLISGFFWGLSLASKWTAVYFIFVLIFYLSWRFVKEKEKFNYIFLIISYTFLPFLIYFSSYLPFYFIGHPNLSQNIDRQSKVVKLIETVCSKIGFSHNICDNTAIIWNIQQQMFWYHTKLDATHPYQSSWYTWPFTFRPIYYSLEDFGTSTAKIYAIGNPAIFWGGFSALIYLAWIFIKRPEFGKGLILVSYFAFFLPWALSPRIMFLYHYLPSIPFLILGTAVILEKIWIKKNGKVFVISFLSLCAFLFFYFYPHIAAWPISLMWNEQYFWFPSWR